MPEISAMRKSLTDKTSFSVVPSRLGAVILEGLDRQIVRTVTDEASLCGAPSRRDAVSMKTLGDKIWKAPAAVMLAAHRYWTVHEAQSS